jgi:hypothetical protein
LILLLAAKLAVYACFKMKATNSKGILRDWSEAMTTGTTKTIEWGIHYEII